MGTAPTEMSTLLPPDLETLRRWRADAEAELKNHRDICARCQSGEWCLKAHEWERDLKKLGEMGEAAQAKQVSGKG